jgi:hypothetical protein
MSVKTNSVVALFVCLVIILAMKPRFIYSINSSILGRLFLICILIFFAMNNITLALLTLFIIIVFLNNNDTLVEGMENIQTPDTIGEENVQITGEQQVLTKDAVRQKIQDRISDLKAKAQGAQTEGEDSSNDPTNVSTGMDKEDIKNAIQSIPANTIPIDKKSFQSADNVQPSTSSMLTNKSSLTEGFCPCAGNVVF